MGFQQGFRINTNTASLDTYRSYTASQAGLERNIERLSSGLRINRAADDAAGKAVAENLSTRERSMLQALRNANDGLSLLDTAEEAYSTGANLVKRIRELAVQASNGLYSPEDRMQIQVEVSQLVDEINRIASHAQFNGLNVLTG